MEIVELLGTKKKSRSGRRSLRDKFLRHNLPVKIPVCLSDGGIHAFFGIILETTFNASHALWSWKRWIVSFSGRLQNAQLTIVYTLEV
jgi:hypothetical protein